MILGLPGILFVVLGVLAFIPDGLRYAIPALAVIIGSFLALRGFRLDKAFRNFTKWVRDYSPPPFTVQIANFSGLAGILLLLVGCYLGATEASTFAGTVTDDIFAHIPTLAGKFLNGSTYLIGIGLCTILVGRAVRWFFEHDPRLWRTVVIVAGVATTAVMFYMASELLINIEVGYEKLLITIIGGISIIMLTGLSVIVLRRKYRSYFKETEEDVEDLTAN
jgi:uncharacterized membrane protein